jgi:hypothetical protein
MTNVIVFDTTLIARFPYAVGATPHFSHEIWLFKTAVQNLTANIDRKALVLLTLRCRVEMITE